MTKITMRMAIVYPASAAAPKILDDANQADPAGVRDGELQNAGDGNAQQAQQHLHVQAKMAARIRRRSVPRQQAIELVKHADAPPGESGECGAGDAHPRERDRGRR